MSLSRLLSSYMYIHILFVFALNEIMNCHSITGQASRYCSATSGWQLVDVLDCLETDFVELSMQVF